MKKTLLEIYALAVCFVAIICAAIMLGIGAYDVVEMSKPEMTLRSWDYQRYQTNEGFTRDWPAGKEIPDDAKVTALRQEGYRVAVKAEQRDAVQSMVRVFIILLIDGLIFFAHWRLARRARS